MILVTGGTGTLGSEILRLLSQDGVGQSALSWNTQKAPALSAIKWVYGDLAKSETSPPHSQALTLSFLFRVLALIQWHYNTMQLRQ